MKVLFELSKMVTDFFCIEPNPHPYSTAMTPDQLIAAHFMEDMALDFSNWEIQWYREWEQDWRCYEPEVPISLIPLRDKHWQYLKRRCTISHKTRELHLEMLWKYAQTYRKELLYKRELVSAKVNGLGFSTIDAVRIAEAAKQLKAKHDEAQKTANALLAQMEAEQKKWDLAENLTGLRRNSQGALVPALPADTSCGCTSKALCDDHKSEELDKCISALDNLGPVSEVKPRRKRMGDRRPTRI